MQINTQLLILISIIIGIPSTQQAYCSGKPKSIPNNTSPIWVKDHVLIRSNPNAKLYQVGEKSLNNSMHVVHLWGDSMYDIGKAYGSILKEEMQGFLPQVYSYVESEIDDWINSQPILKYLKKFPGFENWLAGSVLDAALDFTYWATQKFTTKSHYDELRGIAEGAGVEFKKLRNFQLIGELTKGSCSMFGAWGPATKEGKTIQLRSLDWDLDGPFWKEPTLVIYHLRDNNSTSNSTSNLGNNWANFGFLGFTGSISGINEHQMAISEIGVSFPDETFGAESRFGNPFTFMLRDILQYDTNLNESIKRLENDNRTCDLLFGVGDGKQSFETFRGFQVSKSVMNTYNDNNLQPNQEWHPRLNHTVYWGMDWLCKAFDEMLYKQLQENYGQIDIYNTKEHIMPQVASGNLQVVIYDLTTMDVLIAYGYKQVDGHEVNAYESNYVHLDMKKLFAEQKP